jgi:hypothetical protein
MGAVALCEEGRVTDLNYPAILVATVVVLAGLAVQVGIEGLTEALALGVAIWIGFPVVILSGSVIHEKVPWKLAAIHAGTGC